MHADVLLFLFVTLRCSLIDNGNIADAWRLERLEPVGSCGPADSSLSLQL